MTSSGEQVAPGWVAIVGGGPGDPGLITRRGWQLLGEADVVVTDHLAPLELLDELELSFGRTPKVVDAAKFPGGRSMPQEVINSHLVDEARAGSNVVRLKGGDPFVFGRGLEEVWACAAAGIRVEVVPGVTSAISLPALAGVSVTHKDVAQAFTVVSGHVPPGHPESRVDWGALARSGATLVVLMGVRSMPAIAAALLAAQLPAETPTVTVIDGASDAVEVIRCRLDELAAEASRFRPPAVTVIGAVAGL
ncbi:uroporphyrinogen-III C-methyltransferase [Jatrophihabitans sp. GAS493]|uniref:uroporphyrinogen-III C-methyltransferase n=1 Tax=Jatrophihabitans sp. GAS493 TaxID=1907575 RepID=UPI000BB76741|nr:uroporphyrinogen-III C-methyltransferase [Jatrophihabitans sp. GAS493]SOD74482.1 uroporphyrinogen-III C-methyltransferase [Jatrophihabitans sp. GAS493]